MCLQVTLLVAFLAVSALADDRPYSYQPPQTSYDAPSAEQSYEDAKYEFDWQVDEDYNKFGQEEQRDGDNTQGSYYVDLPDGRRQTVTYYVDGDSGFVAEVNYEGEARSAEYQQPASYQPPKTGYN